MDDNYEKADYNHKVPAFAYMYCMVATDQLL